MRKVKEMNGKDVWQDYGIKVKECRVKPLIIGGGNTSSKKWNHGNDSDCDGDSGDDDDECNTNKRKTTKSLPYSGRDQNKRHDIERGELLHRMKQKEEKCRAKCLREDIKYESDKKRLLDYINLINSSGLPPQFFIRRDYNRAISDIAINPNSTKIFIPHHSGSNNPDDPISSNYGILQKGM